jgi:hypothetical protein
MKQKHYVNFGTAKTATTWIWDSISQAGSIDSVVKEPQLRIVDNEFTYRQFFGEQNVSVNFNTNLWQLDSPQLQMLGSVSTHRSMIFRNPYDYANSLYNFWQSTITEAEFFHSFEKFFDYSSIVRRVPSIGLLLTYDEITSNPQASIDKVCDFIEIPRVKALSNRVNVTVYRKHLKISKRHSMMLNQYVSSFEDTIQQDLTHWKTYVSD